MNPERKNENGRFERVRNRWYFFSYGSPKKDFRISNHALNGFH